MPEDKGLGAKILGLFVESESKNDPSGDATDAGAQGEKSAAEIVAELAGQNTAKKPAGAGQPAAPAAPRTAIPAPSGPVTAAVVDFDVVFKNAA